MSHRRSSSVEFDTLLNQVLTKSYSSPSSSRSNGFIVNDAAQPQWCATIEFEYVRCRCARRLCCIPHALRLFPLQRRGLRGGPTVGTTASDKGERGEIVSATYQESGNDQVEFAEAARPVRDLPKPTKLSSVKPPPLPMREPQPTKFSPRNPPAASQEASTKHSR